MGLIMTCSGATAAWKQVVRQRQRAVNCLCCCSPERADWVYSLLTTKPFSYSAYNLQTFHLYSWWPVGDWLVFKEKETGNTHWYISHFCNVDMRGLPLVSTFRRLSKNTTGHTNWQVIQYHRAVYEGVNRWKGKQTNKKVTKRGN